MYVCKRKRGDDHDSIKIVVLAMEALIRKIAIQISVDHHKYATFVIVLF